VAQRALVEQLDKSGWDLIVGDAFVRGMRDIGYKSTSYALSELVDNSVQANATWTDVVFGFNKGGAKPAQIAVVDNGWGMVPEMVRASLVWGAGTRLNDRQGFGKYGYGLPSASVSQCLRVEVFSKTAHGPWAKSYLDIEEISKGLWTSNHKINTPEATEEEPPAFIIDHLKAANRWPLEHGTVVVWDKLDGTRLDYKTRDALKDSLLSNLGVIYRNYLLDVPMTVDGAKVEPCDPLFLTPGFRYYDLDTDRAVELPSALVEVSDPVTKKVRGVMRVRFSRLPASFYRKPDHKGATSSGKGVFNERAAVADLHQGIIFLRNGRQIDVVRPPRSLGAFSNPTTDRYWKIEVDFDATLDDEFAMTTAKQQVIPSESVWDRLNDKAKLAENISNMRSTYKKETAEIRATAERKKKASLMALEQAQKFKTTKPVKDTQIRRDEANKNLAEEAKRRAKESGVSEETVKGDIEMKQAGNPLAIETEDLPGAPFFRCLQRGGQRVLLINKDHPFYTDVYAAAGSSVATRAALELLLWTLGDAEVDAEPDSERRSFYEVERQTVWSPNLKAALVALRTVDVADDEDDSTAA
jgi:Skp family chaperone for outer membrane proteins